MYDYQKSVDEYNSEAMPAPKVFAGRASRYEQGSLLQRAFDPLMGAPRDENGTILYTVTDEEMDRMGANDDAKHQADFEKANRHAEVCEVSEEDRTEFHTALYENLDKLKTPFEIEEFQKVLDRELAVFKDGEKYDFVKDIKDAYKHQLSQTAEHRIFKTIPDHAFWDIKKP